MSNRNEFKAKTCPLCAKITQFGDKKIADMNGLYFQVGYSDGGWGRRQDYIDFSDEICLECYGLLVIHVNRFVAVFNSRKGCNHEELQIVKKDREVPPLPVPVVERKIFMFEFIKRFAQYIKGELK